jgi:hypothetical protein
VTDLRFKLKKDGKTVAFLKMGTVKERIDHGVRKHDKLGDIWYHDALSEKFGSDFLWFAWRMNGVDAPVDFDCIHPFVCKDRNGADVYAGDLVSEYNKTYCVEWRDDDLGFSLRSTMSDFKIDGKPYFLRQACVSDQIELLPEVQP